MTPQHDHSPPQHDHRQSASPAIRDIVCGMIVDSAKSPHSAVHGGQEWHFCSAGCRAKFIADPQRYLAPKAPVVAPVGTIWTCPMHPDVRQDHPGACPICGMALEPETVTADTGPNAELVDMTRRFWIALVLTLPVFALAQHLRDDRVE